MTTNRDDDYLICKHYYNHIDDISTDYQDFITFQHKDNHYFAWVHDGKVILRSEAYPDYERTVRGIKAIIKNRDIEDRYSIDTQHGVHFLCLWGGGKNNKHTGNMGEHNEIGRSCPAKTKEQLYNLIGFKGSKFASAVTGYKLEGSAGGKKVAAAAVTGAAAASSFASSTTSKGGRKAGAGASSTTAKAAAVTSNDSEGGFKWWWLLLPLLALAAFFLFKGCGGDDTKSKATAKTKVETKAPVTNAATDVKTELNNTVDNSAEEAKVKAAEMAAQAKADAAAAKAKADAKLKADAAAAKAKRDAKRKAETGGSVSQYNIRIGNKNSGF